MEINSTGVTQSNLTDYLAYWTSKLREKYGNDYVIKPEGVVDNLATASSVTNMMLEDVLMYALKQLNPYTAEGEWQDYLYSLIGLERRYADFTVVQRTVSGTAGLRCEKGSIRFKNKATDDIFELNSDCLIDTDGTCKASFTAIELGGIDLPSEALLEIIDAPEGVTGVYYVEGDTINIGDDYEDDEEFRIRWQQNQSIANSATSGGVEKYLLDLVTSEKNLNIVQNRTNSTVNGIPPHSMQVVIFSAESDETIAQTIFNHLLDGVLLYGETTVEIEDSAGTKEPISFTRAKNVPIYFKVQVKVQTNYLLPQLDIRNAIVEHFDLQMGDKVIANNFIEYINNVEGVDYIADIKVSEDNETWVSVDELEYNEIASVQASHITVVKVDD